MKFRLIFIGFLFLFSSCWEKEKAIVLPAKTGNSITKTLELGSEYQTVIFFDFSSGNIYEKQLDSWDLSISCLEKDFSIRMNGGKNLQIAKTGKFDFIEVSSAGGLTWLWDNPNGDKDSTAIDQWFEMDGNNQISSKNEVYVVDFGLGKSPRFKKFQIIDANENALTIKHSELNGNNEANLVVQRNNQFANVYASLNGAGSLVDFEPLKEDWDIVFIRYRHIYYDMTPITPYLVTGVLKNRYKTLNIETNIAFADINPENLFQFNLNDEQDEVGFDWKVYNFDTNQYDLIKDKRYIIKDSENKYFKLQFIDYYSENGLKGSPKFEYEAL